MEELWMQDSVVKGLRLVVFKRADKSGIPGLEWLRDIEGDTEGSGSWYTEDRLKENGWIRCV